MRHTRSLTAGALLAACLSPLLFASVPGESAAADDPSRVQLAQAAAQRPKATPKTNPKSAATPDPGATVNFTAPQTSLALLVRDLCAKTNQSVVLMNGVELVKAGPYDSKKLTGRDWVDVFAKDTQLRVDHGPAYDFIFAPGYEVLSRTSIAAQIPPTIANQRTSLHFDLDTPLFSALALLSHSMKTAIAADNIVSDARCGEIHLDDVSVGEAVDALLQSARVAMTSIRVQSDTESVLLYSAARPLRDQLFIQEGNAAKPELLDRRITLYLPSTPTEPGRLAGYSRAVPLAQSLTQMAEQTGLHFEADPRMQTLPVNPAVMVNVRLETALNLIVNQWPLPQFGYRISGDTVRFVFLGPPVEK